MPKLLVNAPDGAQEIIEVGEGGGYFDSSRVLWDERIDGAMPAVTLGSMRREGDSLIIDATLQTAHDAAMSIRTRPALKAARAEAVAAIKATVTSGKVFDGDEESQTRMARAIIGMQAAGVGTIDWTLADNTNTTVTLAELTEALILSGQQQAALWPIL